MGRSHARQRSSHFARASRAASGRVAGTAVDAFPPVKEEDSLRGLALAWVSLGGSGLQHALAQAEKILPQALAQQPNDPELLAAFAFEEQQQGQTDQIREHYEHALRIQPLFWTPRQTWR